MLDSISHQMPGQGSHELNDVMSATHSSYSTSMFKVGVIKGVRNPSFREIFS